MLCRSLLIQQIALLIVNAIAVQCETSQTNYLGRGHEPPGMIPFASAFPDPNIDPFYEAPPYIAFLAPGHVIRSRRVFTTVTGRTTSSFQVFYRTTDNHNNAIGSVATIWIPSNPVYPPKLLSYPQAEDAVNLDCTPSWAWVNSSSALEDNYQSTAFALPWALAQGYYVVISDAEGPDSAWLVGLTEGRATLDGIRTTIEFLHLPLHRTEIALLSYSGGAHSIVWASSLAEQYAPELKIVGAAFGGTPVDPLSAYILLNGGPSALTLLGALIGLSNGHPELNRTFNALYTTIGSETVAKLRAPNQCINAIPSSDYSGLNVSTLFTGCNILVNPVLLRVLSEESLLSNISCFRVPVPRFPRFQWHGTADSTIPYGSEAAYVEQQCARGADIRFLTLPGLNHVGALVSGAPGALQFIRQAFEGKTVKAACGANLTVPALGSTAAKELLGVNLDRLLAAELQVLKAHDE